MGVFVGELIIWTVALCWWLWPAYERHKLAWWVWDRLHPTPAMHSLPPPSTNPPLGLGYQIAKDPIDLDGLKATLAKSEANIAAIIRPAIGTRAIYGHGQFFMGSGYSNAHNPYNQALQNIASVTGALGAKPYNQLLQQNQQLADHGWPDWWIKAGLHNPDGSPMT